MNDLLFHYMKKSVRKGFSFGVTSGIITTLGLMVGLNSSTHSKMIVVGGILIIAIADALSDSLGIHISEESDKNVSQKNVWRATFSTLFFKFLFGLTFVIPVLLFKLDLAVLVGIIWGALALSLLSFDIAKKHNEKPLKVIAEHLSIATIVIILTYYMGLLVANIFV